MTVRFNKTVCIEFGQYCSGPVVLRPPLVVPEDGTDQKGFPRCDYHWERRFEFHAALDRVPAYAGSEI